MSKKTIAKFGVVVILFLCPVAMVSSCSQASSSRGHPVNSAEVSTDYNKPVTVGAIESPDITESSGIASSYCQPNVFWTHNDSGDDAFIFAIDLSGKNLGTWRVAGARNDDWEDIASYKDPSGTCYLYIGDTGNNKLARVEQRVYRVREPSVPVDGSATSRKHPLVTDQASVVLFRYPDTPHDAETVMAQPLTGDIYVLTKRLDGPSLVFKLKPKFDVSTLVVAEQVGQVAVPAVPDGLLTSGAIAQDGSRVVICDYSAAYELRVGSTSNFDDVWKQKPVVVDLGERKQGEAITFTPDSRSIIATSEKKNSPIIQVSRK